MSIKLVIDFECLPVLGTANIAHLAGVGWRRHETERGESTILIVSVNCLQICSAVDMTC